MSTQQVCAGVALGGLVVLAVLLVMQATGRGALTARPAKAGLSMAIVALVGMPLLVFADDAASQLGMLLVAAATAGVLAVGWALYSGRSMHRRLMRVQQAVMAADDPEAQHRARVLGLVEMVGHAWTIGACTRAEALGHLEDIGVPRTQAELLLRDWDRPDKCRQILDELGVP